LYFFDLEFHISNNAINYIITVEYLIKIKE